jgi:hypothetical protein
MAISVLMYMNAVTVVLFVYGLTGMRWHRIFQSLPLNIFSIFALLAFNSWVISRMQRGDALPSHAKKYAAAKGGVLAWLPYLLVSVICLFAGVVVATRH